MLNKIKTFFINNWAALLVATAVGVLTISASFYFRHFSGQYQGIDMFRSDAELNYLAQIQEVYDGHYLLGNIYLKDGKDMPAGIQQPLSAWITAGMGKLLGLNAVDANLYAKFIFPFILTLIIYGFILTVAKRKNAALLGTAFVMLAPATLGLFYFNSWWAMIVNGNFTSADYQFLSYGRSINPQISTLFFFGYFLLLFKAILTNEKRSKIIFAVLAGLILGLSFYTYLFVFSFISVFSVILLIYLLIKKEYLNARYIFWIGLGGLIIASPALINLYRATQLPFYAEATQRVGAFLSHKFIFSRIWWGAAIIYALAYKFITNKELKYFVGIFLFTGFILTNQQVVTGRIIPAPQHYHWYYISPVVGVLGALLLCAVIEKYLKIKWQNLVTIILLFLFAYLGAWFQVRSYQKYYDWVVFAQRYAPAMSWLNKHTPRDAAVLGNDDASHLMVGFTHNNAYYHGGLTDFPLSTNYLKQALFVYTYLNGVDAKNARSYFTEQRNAIGGWLYGEYWRQQNGCNGCFPEEVFNSLVSDYQNFLTKDFLTELKKNLLDYVLWDKAQDPNWRIDRYFKNVVFTNGPLAIYQVN